jgi:hypothetical protein
MGDLSVRKASSIFRKLQVKNGNILLVKRSVISEGDDLDKLRSALGHLGLNALVLVVDDMDDVKSLDEGMMRKLGWIRMDSFIKAIKK